METERISLFTDGIYPYMIGGMQKHALRLANTLAKRGIDVDLYHVVKDKSQLDTYPDPLERNVHSHYVIGTKFPFPGHYLLEQYLDSKKIYEKALWQPDPDLVYAEGFSAWYLLQRRSRPTVAVNFHGYEVLQKKIDSLSDARTYLLRRYMLNNIRRTDYVFTHGERFNNLLVENGIPREKFLDNNNCVDPAWLADRPVSTKTKGRIRLAFIGRNERRKGITELTQALRQIEDGYDFEFHLVGPIPREIVSEKIIYHGTIANEERIKQIIDQCDVLVCPSYSEGMPTVILEAMSRGLAILATDVGAVPRMVSHENGWLITMDQLPVLHEILADVITCGPAELEQKKKTSLQKIRWFTWEEEVTRLLETFSRIPAKKKPSCQ